MAYPRSSSSSAHYVGVGKQSVKGTGVAPTVFIPYQGTVDFDPGMDGDDIREAGTGPFVNRTMKTKQDPNGSAALAWRPKTLAQISAWFLGTDNSVLNGSLYDHTATPSEANTWLTVEQAAGVSGDIIERVTDCVLKGLTVSCEGNGDLESKLMWIGMSPAWQATAATPTYESGVSGSTPGAPFRAMEATYTIDGAGAANVQSWELGLEWKLDEDIRLSRITRSEILKLELSGKIKVKQLIDSGTMTNEYRKIVYGSTSGTVPIKNFFQGGAFVAAFDNGLSTTNLRTVTFNLPVVDWKVTNPPVLNPDGATMYLEREGTVRVSGGTFCSIVSKTADVAAY